MARIHGRAETPVTVRPIRATDAAGLEQFYAELSLDSRVSRFFGVGPAVGCARSRAFCAADHRHREGFVAVVRDEAGMEHVVGHACAEPDDVASAEVAVAVADAYQGRGIGRRLVRAVVAWGRKNGLRRLDATVYVTNARILGLFRGLGLPMCIDRSDGPTCHVSIDLTASLRPAAAWSSVSWQRSQRAS